MDERGPLDLRVRDDLTPQLADLQLLAEDLPRVTGVQAVDQLLDLTRRQPRIVPEGSDESLPERRAGAHRRPGPDEQHELPLPGAPSEILGGFDIRFESRPCRSTECPSTCLLRGGKRSVAGKNEDHVRVDLTHGGNDRADARLDHLALAPLHPAAAHAEQRQREQGSTRPQAAAA